MTTNFTKNIKISFFTLLIFTNINAFSQQKDKNGFIGIVVGSSYPISDFGDNSINNNNSGFAEIDRITYIIDFGYRFGKYYGLSASYFAHTYSVDTSSADLSWSLGGIVAGPMLILPLSDKVYFDLRLNIGYVSANLSIDHNLPDNLMGHGLGIDLKALVRYNIFKRWCIIAEASYLNTNQKFDSGLKRNFQVMNFNLGLGFRI